MNVPMVGIPAGASMIDATSSRDAIANTSSMDESIEGRMSGTMMRRSVTVIDAPDTRAAVSKLPPIWSSAALP